VEVRASNKGGRQFWGVPNGYLSRSRSVKLLSYILGTGRRKKGKGGRTKSLQGHVKVCGVTFRERVFMGRGGATLFSVLVGGVLSCWKDQGPFIPFFGDSHGDPSEEKDYLSRRRRGFRKLGKQLGKIDYKGGTY